MDTIVLAGGGTAGHIAPNLALLPFLKDFSVHYAGETGGMEDGMAKDAGLPFHGVSCIKFHRGNPFKNAKVPFVLHKGVKEAKRLLKDLNPCVVFSKGGYAALPVCLAANKLKIPLVIHESDTSLGLTNRLVAKKAKFVCTTFPAVAEKLENGLYTGTPLRQALYHGNAETIYRTFALPKNGKKNLLVFGGSQGALHVNEALEKGLEKVCRTFNVLHIAGKHAYDGVRPEGYARAAFCTQMADCYAWADFVLCRAGAGTLTEIAALKKPALAIPLPKSSTSRGDQEKNALVYADRGMIDVLFERDLSPESLLSALYALVSHAGALKEAIEKQESPDGTKKIAELLKSFRRSD